MEVPISKEEALEKVNAVIETKAKEPFSPLQYQGVLVRAYANIFDQLIVGIPIYFLFRWASVSSTNAQIDAGFFIFLYFILTEAIYGKTIGKKLFKIKVMMVDGRRCTPLAALLRNLGRLLDLILGSYILGIILIIFTSKKQRIGDLIAKTVVVKI